MSPKVETLDLSWAIGKYGDGSMEAIITHAEKIAVDLLMEYDPGHSREFVETQLDRSCRHFGDCKKARSWEQPPMTCDACIYDEFILKAFEKMKVGRKP